MARTAIKAPTHRGSTSLRLRRLREGAAEDAARWARDRGEYQGRRSIDASGFATDRDLSPNELIRARRNSRRNYKSSGIFGAMVDQAVAHVIGDGVTVAFKDEAVGEYVLGQLDARRNRFLCRVDELFRRWIVDGENVITFRSLTRNGTVPTGDVWIGLCDPNEISGFQVDAWNDQRTLAVKLPTPKAPEGTTLPPEYPTSAWIPTAEVQDDGLIPPGYVVPRFDAKGKKLEAGTGDEVLHCYYMRLNALGARGVPLFSRTVDKVTLLDLLVDHLMAKAEYTNRHWLHVTYKQKDAGGKSDKAFENKMLKWAIDAQPGEAAVTSDDVKVQVLSPDLKLIDQKALYEIGVGYILGSHSMPRVWFGESAGERSGAAEAGSPIHRLLKSLQGRTREALEDVVAFMIAMGKTSRRLKAEADEGFTVNVAEFATRDSVRDVQELTWAGNALDSAVLNGSVSREERQRMIRKIIAGKPFGSELDDEAPPLPDEQLTEEQLGLLPAVPGAAAADPEGRTTPNPTEKPGAGASPPGSAPPSAPGVVGPAPIEVQKTALNGSQIAAIVDLCAQVTAGTLNPEAAKSILALAFPGYDLEQMAAAIDAAEAEGEKVREENHRRELETAEAAKGAEPEGDDAPDEPPKA